MDNSKELVERARRSVGYMTSEWTQLIRDLCNAVEALEAENERLRDALLRIRSGSFDDAIAFSLEGKWKDISLVLQEMARAALEGKDDNAT